MLPISIFMVRSKFALLFTGDSLKWPVISLFWPTGSKVHCTHESQFMGFSRGDAASPNVSRIEKQQKDNKPQRQVVIPDIQSIFRLILSCVQGRESFKTRMGVPAANAVAKASTKTLSKSLDGHCSGFLGFVLHTQEECPTLGTTILAKVLILCTFDLRCFGGKRGNRCHYCSWRRTLRWHYLCLGKP